MGIIIEHRPFYKAICDSCKHTIESGADTGDGFIDGVEQLSNHLQESCARFMGRKFMLIMCDDCVEEISQQLGGAPPGITHVEAYIKVLCKEDS